MDYVVVIEKAPDGSYSAYVPDLPGCVTCGDTQEEVRNLIKEAIALHIESLRTHGEPVPPPAATATVVHAA
jgi:predicted RNase H-like HicB family nuclease